MTDTAVSTDVGGCQAGGRRNEGGEEGEGGGRRREKGRGGKEKEGSGFSESTEAHRNPYLVVGKFWLVEETMSRVADLFLEYLREKKATRTTTSRTTVASTVVTTRIGMSWGLLESDVASSATPSTTCRREKEHYMKI